MAERERIAIYAVLAALLLLVAISLALATHRQTSRLGACRSILLQGGRDACLSNLAQSSGNASVCGYSSGSSADYCYEAVATQLSEPAVCTNISSAQGAYSCVVGIANATGSYGDCAYLNGTYEHDCVDYMAVKLRSPEICTNIRNSTAESVCSSGIYFGLAKNASDSAYCSLVSDTANKQYVLGILTISDMLGRMYGNLTSINNLNPAEYIGGNASYSARDLCNFAVATEGVPSACGRISNATLGSICTSSMQYADSGIVNSTQGASPPSSICDSYTGVTRDACMAMLATAQAVGSGNVTVCDGIGNLSLRYGCYASMARAYNSTSYCGNIVNASANEACVQDINYNFT